MNTCKLIKNTKSLVFGHGTIFFGHYHGKNCYSYLKVTDKYNGIWVIIIPSPYHNTTTVSFTSGIVKETTYLSLENIYHPTQSFCLTFSPFIHIVG